MDWVDAKLTSSSKDRAARKHDVKSRKGKKGKLHLKKDDGKRQGKRLSTRSLRQQLSETMQHPQNTWATTYAEALRQLPWPDRCTTESTFLWSAVIEEQAEVLCQAGVPRTTLEALHEDLSTESNPANDGEQLPDLAFKWLETADAYPQDALAVAALAWDLRQQLQTPGQEWLAKWYQSLLDGIETYEADSTTSVVCHLVMQCELPLLLATATGDRKVLVEEANRAMDMLAEYLESGQQNPDAWLFYGGTYLRAALASVLRCRVLANAIGLRKWYPSQQKALASILTHAARWSRPDGTQLLATDVSSPRHKAIWMALQAMARCSKAVSSALTLSGIGKGKRGEIRRQVRASSLPALTYYSEDTSGACMQCDWRQKGGRVAVDFSDAEMCIEALGPKGKPVLGGEWTTRVEIDGQPQLQLDEWSEVCWFSDEDVDYLELQGEFGEHAKVQRQVILFRTERLLYLADALITETESELSLRSRLPLASGTSFEPAEKTTEGTIVNDAGSRSLVLPLFLPEWRRQLNIRGDTSCLRTEEGDLSVVAEAKTRCIYMPVLISLSHVHATRPYTWRHLTVGDELRIVGDDEARAFRIQIGSEQWFAYCNLAKPVRRTALGMHTMADFYAGRFDAEDGEFDLLVEVDPPSEAGD